MAGANVSSCSFKFYFHSLLIEASHPSPLSLWADQSSAGVYIAAAHQLAVTVGRGLKGTGQALGSAEDN